MIIFPSQHILCFHPLNTHSLTQLLHFSFSTSFSPLLQKLHWYPLMRDSSCYIFILVILAIFFGVRTPNIIEWWEALILHLLYWVYVAIMYNNDKIRVAMEAIFSSGELIRSFHLDVLLDTCSSKCTHSHCTLSSILSSHSRIMTFLTYPLLTHSLTPPRCTLLDAS